MNLKQKLSWLPAKQVTHTTKNELVGIRGHKNYYGNLVSGKIYFKRGKLRISTGETSIMKARVFVDEYLSRMKTGDSELAVSRKKKGIINLTFKDVWDEIKESKLVSTSPSTQLTYRTTENILKKYFFNINVSSIKNSTIQDFIKWYLTNYPKRRFSRVGIHLKMALHYAHKNGYILSVPDLSVLTGVDEVTAKNARKSWESSSKRYSDTEIDSLVSSFSKFKDPMYKSRIRLAVLLGLRCGLRKMEAMKIKWVNEDGQSFVDMKKKEIRVWSDKNHQFRVIPLPNDVLEAFEVQRHFTKKSPWVFPMPTNNEHHISGQVLDKDWVKLKRLAGVVGRFHDLRHTFASITAEKGWPPVVACELLDQSLVIYQKRYCKPSQDSKRVLMENL